MKTAHLFFTLAITTALSLSAQAQSAPAATQPEKAAAAAMTDGEVRKIDPGQGKVTLRHGPLTHLGMDAMTMVFRVADPKLLEGVKTGDKVRFAADKVNGQFTVTQMEVLK